MGINNCVTLKHSLVLLRKTSMDLGNNDVFCTNTTFVYKISN